MTLERENLLRPTPPEIIKKYIVVHGKFLEKHLGPNWTTAVSQSLEQTMIDYAGLGRRQRIKSQLVGSQLREYLYLTALQTTHDKLLYKRQGEGLEDEFLAEVGREIPALAEKGTPSLIMPPEPSTIRMLFTRVRDVKHK